MEPDPIPVTNFPAPDTTFSAVPYGRIRNFLDGFSFSSPDFGDEDVGAEGGGRYIPGFYPYIVRGVEQPVFDDPDPLAPPPDPPEYLDQIAITTGYIINPTVDDASTESFSVPVFEGQPLDSDPAPSVLLSSGSYAAYLVTATSEVVILPAADAAPDEETGYIFKLFDFTVTVTEGSATLSAIQHYVSNDVVIWSSTGDPAEALHPWKLRQVSGNWQVYGTGATIEKRWSGDTHTVTGLDTDLTIGESSYYIYARATVEYNVVSDFDITVETTALDRIVTDAGVQTELNVLIGMIVSGTATQRLRDPINLTLTCVAGVPAWVPLLSEGVVA